MRGDSAARQLRLLLFLDERRELEVAVAARRLGCAVRTVYRDLGVLERMGIPLYQEREGARARWRLAEGYRQRISLSLNWSEMLALTAVVDPYNLHVQADGVYLIGWSHERGAGRIFLLDRMSGLRRTGRNFARRPDFNPALYLHGAFGPWDGKVVEVRLRFAKRVARVVAERIMHPTQRSQLRADGGLDVTLESPLSPQLKAWVRGFGEDVRVLAPKGLASSRSSVTLSAPVT